MFFVLFCFRNFLQKLCEIRNLSLFMDGEMDITSTSNVHTCLGISLIKLVFEEGARRK